MAEITDGLIYVIKLINLIQRTKLFFSEIDRI